MRDVGDSQPVDTTMREGDNTQPDVPTAAVEHGETAAPDNIEKAAEIDTDKTKAIEDSEPIYKNKSRVTAAKPADDSKATESKATATEEPTEVKTKEVQTSSEGAKTPDSADGECVKL